VAAATYRIGPSDFFTPGDLQADAQTLDAQVSQLDQQILANTSPDFSGSWEAWVSGWRSFYGDHFGGYFSSFLSSWNDSNRDALISYENQFSTWSQQAQQQGAQSYGPTIQPSTGSGDTLGAHLAAQGLPSAGGITALVVAVIVLIVVFGVMK
jgi:hypothetical protein